MIWCTVLSAQYLLTCNPQHQSLILFCSQVGEEPVLLRHSETNASLQPRNQTGGSHRHGRPGLSHESVNPIWSSVKSFFLSVLCPSSVQSWCYHENVFKRVLFSTERQHGQTPLWDIWDFWQWHVPAASGQRTGVSTQTSLSSSYLSQCSSSGHELISVNKYLTD